MKIRKEQKIKEFGRFINSIIQHSRDKNLPLNFRIDNQTKYNLDVSMEADVSPEKVTLILKIK